MRTQYFFHTKTSPRTTIGGYYDPKTQVMKFSSFTFDDKPFEKRIGRLATIGRILKGKSTATAWVNTQMAESPGKVFVQAALTMLNLNEVTLETA